MKKGKKTAGVSVRIYKDSRKQLKIMAIKRGLTLAGIVDELIKGA